MTQLEKLTYKDATGTPHNQPLFREDEARLEIVTEGRPWRFDVGGALLRLASEAQRIRYAHLFDPYLTVHTSLVEPLLRQSLRFVEGATNVPATFAAVINHR